MAEQTGEAVKTVSLLQHHQNGENVTPLIEPGQFIPDRVKKHLPQKSILSHPATIKTEGPQGVVKGEPRPMALRRIRRELFKMAKQGNRQEAVLEGHAWDEIAERFLTEQQDVSVDMGELGVQSAKYVVLTPPESRRTEAQSAKPPIFLIPGISLDLENMGILLQQAVFDGRTAIMIGFPDGWKGNVTDEFGEATEKSLNYDPHTSFFEGAIDEISHDPKIIEKIGEVSKMDLWGFSTGATIVSELLSREKLKDKVVNAVMICPPSCVDQEPMRVFGHEIPLSPKQIFSELWDSTLGNLTNTAKRNVSNREDFKYTEDHRRRQVRTYNALRAKTLRRIPWWENDMQVKEGGKITVALYKGDRVTKGISIESEIKNANPKLDIQEFDGAHERALFDPEPLLEKVL
jgi:hypothetical protein